MKKKWAKKRGCSEQLKVGDQCLYRNANHSRSKGCAKSVIWLPISGYCVVRQLSDGGNCKIDIYDETHKLIRQEKPLIQDLKKKPTDCQPKKKKKVTGRKRNRKEFENDKQEAD